MDKEILLAQPRGFCAGVDRAIEIVERALKVKDEDKFEIAEKRLSARVVNALVLGKPIPDCEHRETVLQAVGKTFVEAQRYVRAAIRAIELVEAGDLPESLAQLVVSCKALNTRAKLL